MNSGMDTVRKPAYPLKMINKYVSGLLGFCLACGAHAEVIDGGIYRQNGDGQFVKLDTKTPFDVGYDNFDTDHLYAFDENQNIVLIDPIRVDIGGVDGVIAAGTVVASHYVFFDSLQSVHHGFVYFDAPILGIAAYQDTMAATDYLADTNVTYIGTDLRGLEEGDHVWVDAKDSQKLIVYWAGSSPGDYIRVFTERSPNHEMIM